MNARDLYLDLMIKAVFNTIYQDGNMNPKRPVDFVSEHRLHGRDWPEIAHSMIGFKRLENLKELCSRAIDQGISGDFVETGVWRGGACILMRGVLAAYEDKERRVFCCDSFEGLPRPDSTKYRDNPEDKHHTYDELRVSLEEVQENFARYGLLDNQVVFVKGFFAIRFTLLIALRLLFSDWMVTCMNLRFRRWMTYITECLKEAL